MEIVFRYSKYADLIFHVLAHMQVNNASNLYSQKYVDYFSEYRHSGVSNFHLRSEVAQLERYYNENFERLGIINFLPITENCIEFITLKNLLLSYNGFTEEDIACFIRPLISILEKESIIYSPFWEDKYHRLQSERETCESQLKELIKPYDSIFRYYNKYATVYLSLSLTCNGRGVYAQDSFCAAVPLPTNQEIIKYCFFQLLHEYTHQFTDVLLNKTINMMDGSHDLSENLVILTDYLLIQRIDKVSADNYLIWLAEISGTEKDKINETEFLKSFCIPAELHCLMEREIANILE